MDQTFSVLLTRQNNFIKRTLVIVLVFNDHAIFVLVYALQPFIVPFYTLASYSMQTNETYIWFHSARRKHVCYSELGNHFHRFVVKTFRQQYMQATVNEDYLFSNSKTSELYCKEYYNKND